VEYSRHVIINGWCVMKHTEAKYFYNSVMKLMDDRAWPTEFVDGQIYSSVQNFRMTGFTKNGRTKKIVSNHSFADTLITYVRDCKLLEQQCIEETSLFAPISVKFPANTQTVIDGVDTTAFRFVKQKGSMLIYDRIMPSHCQICGRTHDSVGMYLTARDGIVRQHCYRGRVR